MENSFCLCSGPQGEGGKFRPFHLVLAKAVGFGPWLGLILPIKGKDKLETPAKLAIYKVAWADKYPPGGKLRWNYIPE